MLVQDHVQYSKSLDVVLLILEYRMQKHRLDQMLVDRIDPFLTENQPRAHRSHLQLQGNFAFVRIAR